MQLFGLTNALLANHRDTSKRNLAIRRYAVIPLSPNCGIIGWVKKKKFLAYFGRSSLFEHTF